MKKRLIAVLLSVLIIGGIARQAVRTAGARTAEHHPQAAASPLPPAAYPPSLWEELGRLPGIDISQEDPETLPRDLPWQSGEQETEWADPAAVKGGLVRLCSPGPYPANFLAFGSPSPQFFHHTFRTAVEIQLLAQHPATGAPIPGTASRWAQQGDTLYFEIDPDARYSNGRPVRAADYALGLLLRAKAGNDATLQQLSRLVRRIRILGSRRLALTLRAPRPRAALAVSALLHAAEPGFYAEFGSDYARRYAQRIPPTTGGYTIGSTERGRSITLERIKNWWAKDKPFYRHTCNADQVQYLFLASEAQAWEFLKRGKLDAIQTRNIAAWRQHIVDNNNLPPDILARQAKAETPLPPYGIILNPHTLPDPSLRKGLIQAMDMEKAIGILYQGEGEQLSTFTSGYGSISPTDAPAHPYDPTAARAAFAAAGFTAPGADGILRKPDGTPLRIRLSYVPSEKTSALVAILAQSARHCGADIRAEALSWQQNAREIDDGTYHMTFWAAMPAAPLPAYREIFLHHPPNHQSPFALSDPPLTHAICAVENAATEQELAAACRAVDARIRDLAIWLPGWKENLILLAHRKRLRFPDTPACRFTPPRPYEVMDGHLYWVTPPQAATP